MSAERLLSARGLTRRFGGLVATDQVSLGVAAGEIHALIGPNGAGKSTVIAQLAGELAPSAGRIAFDGTDITRLSVSRRVRLGVARSYQITSILRGLSVEDNVAVAVLATQGHSYRFFASARRDEASRAPARALLAEVGLAARGASEAGTLAHGEQRQLEIAMALATRPRLLLLDEPMAGMGAEETATMIAILRRLKSRIGMLLVEHDMDAVFALADRISVMVSGRVIAAGDAAAIRANADVQAAYLGDGEA